MIELSLNEVEMLAAKVARGAGFSWGLCDDVGKCARALAVGGLPWAASLLALANDTPALIAPTLPLTRGGAPGSCLCPVRTGALVADRPDVLDNLPLQIDRVAHPLWFAGFAVLWSTPLAVRLSWHGACADIRGGAIAAKPEDPGLLATAASVTVDAAPDIAPAPDQHRRAGVDPSTFAALGAIAARTYVPASDQSRAMGAGGSRTDDE